MRLRTLCGTAICVIVALAAVPDVADAQFGKLKKAAERAVEREAANQVDRLLANAIRCLVDDPVCYEDATASGEEVIFVDDQGEVITDGEGVPVTDREQAAAAAPAPPKPGEGVWVNYDFQPGDEILFYEDFTRDNVGDFPRRLGFVRGNWEVAEWNGRRLLRHTGPRYSAIKVALPAALPERFTVEIEMHLAHGNQRVHLATSEPEDQNLHNRYGHNILQVDGRESGVEYRGQGPKSTTQSVRLLNETLAPVRIMVDGAYAKMYVGEQRVSNIPVADFPRGRTLWIQNVYNASEENPIYIGSIRVAAGGADLYDKLAAEGRVATRGILFASNSDRIRPESTPTLKEIGTMLEEHPELQLRIEGHTDADGDEAHNLDLSQRRAASVMRYLVDSYSIGEARLEAAGLGESQPVGDNATPEGKQKNRRVELVRI